MAEWKAEFAGGLGEDLPPSRQKLLLVSLQSDVGEGLLGRQYREEEASNIVSGGILGTEEILGMVQPIGWQYGAPRLRG